MPPPSTYFQMNLWRCWAICERNLQKSLQDAPSIELALEGIYRDGGLALNRMYTGAFKMLPLPLYVCRIESKLRLSTSCCWATLDGINNGALILAHCIRLLTWKENEPLELIKLYFTLQCLTIIFVNRPEFLHTSTLCTHTI